nr:hypothetical protein [Cutibacterium porci]
MDNPPTAPYAEGIYGIARMERVMSRNPHQPRAFSLAHIMIPAWLPLGALMTWAGVSMFLDNTDGFREGYAGWIIILGSLAAPYTGLAQGLWLRPGVDHDKIWTRFGHLFYLRLLEELHHRHIQLPQADITDPNWDEQAQIWRNGLAEDVWVDHRDFYDTHPEQLARLNALIPPPDHYDA